MKSDEIMKDVKLPLDMVQSINDKLQGLVSAKANIHELAYAGNLNSVASCSCEKGCEGCTSW